MFSSMACGMAVTTTLSCGPKSCLFSPCHISRLQALVRARQKSCTARGNLRDFVIVLNELAVLSGICVDAILKEAHDALAANSMVELVEDLGTTVGDLPSAARVKVDNGWTLASRILTWLRVHCGLRMVRHHKAQGPLMVHELVAFLDSVARLR